MCFSKRVLHLVQKYKCVNCVLFSQKNDTHLLCKMSEDILMKNILHELRIDIVYFDKEVTRSTRKRYVKLVLFVEKLNTTSLD